MYHKRFAGANFTAGILVTAEGVSDTEEDALVEEEVVVMVVVEDKDEGVLRIHNEQAM